MGRVGGVGDGDFPFRRHQKKPNEEKKKKKKEESSQNTSEIQRKKQRNKQNGQEKLDLFLGSRHSISNSTCT